MWYAASKRKDAIAALISAENARLQPEGLAWAGPLEGRGLMLMALTWVPGVRQQVEGMNPHRRRISAEPIPMEFLPMEMKMAVAMAQAQQMQSMQNPQPVMYGQPGGVGADIS